ncbi:MAG TPA: hypothetical protein VF789_11945 [Thermoanaerobaculia bacterium]
MKAFRKLLCTAAVVSAVFFSIGPSQAQSLPACCQNCFNQYSACLNACGCSPAYDWGGCSFALDGCTAQCQAQGIYCPLI